MIFGSSNPVVDIGIAMTLQDRFSGPAGEALSSWNKILAEMNTYSAGMKQALGNSIASSVSILKSMYGAFEYSATIEKNAFLSNKMINDGADHQKQLLDLAKEINVRNPLNLYDITSGEKFMAMAGMTYEQIKNSIEPAAQLAAIFNHELGGKGGTADLMTNIMATFNKAPEEAKEVADILGVGVTSANMGLDDLAQTIKYMGASAKMAGLDLKEVVTIAGVLGNRGVQGSMAGTNAGQALLQLMMGVSGAHKKSSEALKRLGLGRDDLMDANGNLLKIDQVLTKVAEKIKGLGGVDTSGILHDIFGTRGTRALEPLLKDLLSADSQYKNILNKISNSSGWAESTMTEYNETPQGTIDRMKSAFENMVVNLGVAYKTFFQPVISTLANVFVSISKFLDGDFGRWAAGLAAISVTIGLIRNAFRFISLHIKFMTGGLAGSATASNTMQSGLAGARVQAAGITAEMRMQTILMARMALMANAAAGGGGRMAAFFGSNVRMGMAGSGPNRAPALFRKDKKTGRWVQVDKPLAERYFSMYLGGGSGIRSGNSSGAGGSGIIASSQQSNVLARSLSRMFGSSVGGVLGRTVVPVLGGISSVLGSMLGGPIGMAAGVIISVLPLLLNRDDNKKHEDDIEVKRKADLDRITKALREGKPTTVSVNINGRPVGNYQDGDKVEIDWGNESDNYGLTTY